MTLLINHQVNNNSLVPYTIWIPQRAEALLHLRCIELNGNT
jgi:hypothetical protein